MPAANRQLILDDLATTFAGIVAGATLDGLTFAQTIRTVERVLRSTDEVASRVGVAGLPWVGYGPASGPTEAEMLPGRIRHTMPVMVLWATGDSSDLSDARRTVLASQILDDLKAALLYRDRTTRGGYAIATYWKRCWTDEGWPRQIQTSSPTATLLVAGGIELEIIYEEDFATAT